MNVVVASFGSDGDFNPLLAIAEALVRRGANVSFVANPQETYTDGMAAALDALGSSVAVREAARSAAARIGSVPTGADRAAEWIAAR